MSSSQARRANAASAAAGQDRSLLQLLDSNDMLPGHTTADLYSLRHFTLRGGLPDSPSWLRAQAWKVLLGYLPPEKKEWSSTLAKRRREYYQFVGDLSPDAHPLAHPVPASQITNNDRLLDQIYKDLVRSRNNGFAFYQAPPRPSASCPVAPLPPVDAQPGPSAAVPVQRLETRDNLLHRLAAISHEYAQQLSIERVASSSTSSASRHPPQILHVQTSSHPATVSSSLAPHSPSDIIDDPIKSPPILLSPPSPGGMSRESSQHSFASANEALEDAASSHSHGGRQSSSQYQAATDARSGLESSADAVGIPSQRNWHSLLRILYLFAVLNPSIGYVQGMNEVLFTLLYVFGSAQYPPTISTGLTPSSSQHDIAPGANGSSARTWDNEADLADLTTHAEADAFWCFSALVGEMRELYDFERIEQQSRGVASAERQPSHSGMAGALRRFSLRIKWLDLPLWRTLQSASLDPRLPYYSLRWLACLLSTELSLPSVLRIWDALLAEQESAGISGSAKIEFLIDVCASMMLHIKHRLPHSNDEDMDLETEGFSYGMRVLQNYPDDDISPVVEQATLIRQRRLAADLTGDGPPDASDDDDEGETNPRIAAVKARAAQAWRDWTGPRQDLAPPALPAKEPTDATPAATKGGWLVSRARPRTSQATNDDGDLSIASSTDAAASDTSISSKGTFSGFLAKYAEAVQSSDAAANLSKASTNFTAKAMARFGDRGSRESTPETSASPNYMYGSLGRGLPTSPTGSMVGSQDSRFASLGSVGAGFFTRSRRNASESQSPSVGWDSPHTPDITRWSRDTMPDFPLPNVADSPAGRMEYVDTFGKRISMAPNGRGGTSPSSSVAGDVSRERRGSENASSFPLPSMRAAARMGILPSRFREESASPSQRPAGPKPLLLSQSARPPREGSNSPRSLAAEEPSRKISSGPMAHSMSRGNSHQDGSVAGSFSGRSSRSVSAADSRRSSMADFADSSMPGLSEVGAVPPLPSLTGQSSASMLPGRSMPANGAISDGSRTLPGTATPLQGLASKDGIVSAGAFARATKATESERERPKFGHVSSSSDVPLVQTTSSSISRPRTSNRQRTSSSTVDSRAASFSESITGNQFSNRSSQTTNVVDGLADQGVVPNGFVNGEVAGVVVSEEPASVHDLSAHSKVETTNGVSRSGTPLSERPDTASADASYALINGAASSDPIDPATGPEPVRKYTLTDDPLPAPIDAKIVRSKRLVKGRQNSSSSASSSRRSLAGLRRSSRNSVEPAPPSPQLALPEVEEDVYGGIVDGELGGDGEPGVEAQWHGGGGEAEEMRRQQGEKLDMRSLRIREPNEISPVGRPSTDRSNFF